MDHTPEIARFFDDFVTAFASFNGPRIAERYRTPYLAFQRPNDCKVFLSQDEIGAYFQRVVDGYRAQGCRRCAYRELRVVELGADGALATVSWDLFDDGGQVLSTWRESYNLCFTEGCCQIYASTDHD